MKAFNNNRFKIVTIGLPVLLQEIIVNALEKHITVTPPESYESLSDFQTSYKSSDKYLDVSITPDLVVIESESEKDCKEMLSTFPLSKILLVEKTGASMAVWTMIPRKTELGKVSSDALAEIILSVNNGG